jgi:hypothetical protein
MQRPSLPPSLLPRLFVSLSPHSLATLSPSRSAPFELAFFKVVHHLLALSVDNLARINTRISTQEFFQLP